ncbi:hypothetical protein FA95DRAFT_771740 [Auriscalpium vulgare]|uniref:Uncharacterized protein n=1 Tax=Auriscalpium vulgare TaxID=40419 RepID=A0ACB8RBU8_9AGAM|nr:hypothetical protein FA95DRAFT_771740 [Auriscalpium vulgare]
MSNGSPTAYLLWAILACLFLAFFVYHLWSYDRFQCLRWNAGRQPGAFKRIMTYSYFLSVPLLVVFSVGMTVVKFREGFILMGDSKIIPRPATLWSLPHQHFLLGLSFIFSIAWSSEQVTHFEELAFWLFLLDQGPDKGEWFSSWEYRLWYCSCVSSVLGMPLTALIARHDLDTIDAWIFLVGALASTVTNVFFLYVLFRFPGFLRHVKSEGADPDVVVRLSTFYELNLVRMLFRFAATVPLLILAVDGIRGSHPINEKQFWADFLLMISAIGQFISSSITLLIFFPRSVTKEAGYRHKAPSTGTASLLPPVSPKFHSPNSSRPSPAFYVPASPPTTPGYPQPTTPGHPHTARSSVAGMEAFATGGEPAPGYIPSDVEIGRRKEEQEQDFDHPEPHGLVRRETVHGDGTSRIGITLPKRSPTRRFPSTSTLHPYVTSYTSPIDLIDLPQDSIPPRSA